MEKLQESISKKQLESVDFTTVRDSTSERALAFIAARFVDAIPPSSTRVPPL